MIKLQSTSRFKPDSQSRLFIDARNPNMHHVYPTSSIKRQYVAAIVANLPCGKSCTHNTLDGVKLFIYIQEQQDCFTPNQRMSESVSFLLCPLSANDRCNQGIHCP